MKNPNSTYQLRRSNARSLKDGKTRYQYSVSIHPDLGDVLWANGHDRFTVELTDEGVLFRPWQASVQAIPEWLHQDKGNSNA